jgi:hypothetical protein
MKAIAEHIFELAQQIAERTPGFQKRIGPGNQAVHGGRPANRHFEYLIITNKKDHHGSRI